MTVETAAALAAENIKTVYAWALSKTSNKDDAEELTSEIVLASIENAPRLKNDKAYYGWFWQIAKNTYRRFNTERSRYRRHFSESDEDLASGELGVEDRMIVNEEIAKLRREIAFLGKYYRICTTEYYFNDKSVTEIASEYSLTPEMVKYYLFKTRKILKEGIAMERQFGEKSFNPAKFELVELFSGSISEEYRNLFHERKLPGQILATAYYEPMTMNELAFELGVPTVYLEDEMSVLMKYDFIKKVGKDHYQTNMFIYDDEFVKTCFSKIVKCGSEKLKAAAQGIASKQKEFRDIGFAGCGLDEELLAWDSAVLCVIDTVTQVIFPEDAKTTVIDKDNRAIVHGSTCSDDVELDCSKAFQRFMMSGRWYPDRKNVFSYIGFSVNGEFPRGPLFYDKIKNTHDDPYNSPIPSFTNEEYGRATTLFERERQLLDEFYHNATSISLAVAKESAPEGIFLNEPMMFSTVLKVIFAAVFDSFDKNGIKYPDTELAGVYGLR